MESVILVECDISSLKLVMKFLPNTFELEQRLVHLDQLNEQCRDIVVAIEVNKCRVKDQ